MGLTNDLLTSLPHGEIVEVLIGLHWTAVVAEVEGRRSCGLSSTIESPHLHGGGAQVPQAGQLATLSGHELAALALDEERLTLASVGVAAINALLPLPQAQALREINAEHVLVKLGTAKRIALIGHFPFASRLKEHAGELVVLERNPRAGELPAESADQVLPQSEVVAITGMALANHTLEHLLEMCSPDATVMILGPSTPLSPLLFDHGVDLLSCSIVESIEPVLAAIGQGANFRQVHRAGVRLVTMQRPGFTMPI